MDSKTVIDFIRNSIKNPSIKEFIHSLFNRGLLSEKTRDKLLKEVEQNKRKP